MENTKRLDKQRKRGTISYTNLKRSGNECNGTNANGETSRGV